MFVVTVSVSKVTSPKAVEMGCRYFKNKTTDEEFLVEFMTASLWQAV